jgi:hypothetical protein
MYNNIKELKLNKELLKTIELFYGIYDISVKIAENYKNNGTEIYFNSYNIFNRNNEDEFFENTNKYIKSTYDKTLFEFIKSYNIGDFYDFENDFILQLLLFKNKNYFILLFPPFKVIETDEIYKNIDIYAILEDCYSYITENDKFIICGHSFGSVLSQIFAVNNFWTHNRQFQKNTYIIGTCAYLWSKIEDNINNYFDKNYKNRYLFFGSCFEDINNDFEDKFKDTICIDGFLSKYYTYEKDYVSLPTIILCQNYLDTFFNIFITTDEIINLNSDKIKKIITTKCNVISDSIHNWNEYKQMFKILIS